MRPSQAHQRREDILPIIASAFAETGYRRTTTAELARRCELQETQLYRLWPSKKAMLLAVLDHLYEDEVGEWETMLSGDDPGGAIRAVLEAEGRERGRTGLQKVIFAALTESDDPEVREAVSRMYKQFHRFIRDTLKEHHADAFVAGPEEVGLDPSLAAWALIGLGTITNIAREFGLFSMATQKKLMTEAGMRLAGE